MEAYCPECRQSMQWRNAERFYCVSCERSFERLALCPECRLLLQRLKACGADSYLCQHGHGLISRSRVIFCYQPVPSE
ncbi:zinc ribbon domain-containing protein [Musicola paradisiaca]|uniref:Replication restart DNA helicase PriA n=1 Tax=Musicola paradisiaca (strain Ech703) TaxID=579405 RepID=C6CAL1_MUSP7|nr:zinc ribbon domain-containing protein [Musicola paradisiaca]ACS86509.1 protein of unknown function DUF1407 [Musicola paradisiaca Ech703]